MLGESYTRACACAGIHMVPFLDDHTTTRPQDHTITHTSTRPHDHTSPRPTDEMNYRMKLYRKCLLAMRSIFSASAASSSTADRMRHHSNRVEFTLDNVHGTRKMVHRNAIDTCCWPAAAPPSHPLPPLPPPPSHSEAASDLRAAH